MRKKDFTKENKIDLLKYFSQVVSDELYYRREREYRVFTWSSSIFLALIGALLIYRQNVDALLDPTGKIIVSFVVILLLFFSNSWLLRDRNYRAQNEKILAHVSTLLHCYDKGFYDPVNKTTLFPNEWSRFGEDHTTFRKKFLRPNFSTAIFLLGLLTLLMLWLT